MSIPTNHLTTVEPPNKGQVGGLVHGPLSTIWGLSFIGDFFVKKPFLCVVRYPA